MPAARIVCIGNPYEPRDWVGPAVYEALADAASTDIEVVDGGLAGLNLLRLLEGVPRVVFADTLVGDDATDEPVVLAGPFATDAPLAFDHAGGLSYLLAAAPLAVSPMPEVWVVGATAAAGRDIVPRLARTALELARGRPAAAL